MEEDENVFQLSHDSMDEDDSVFQLSHDSMDEDDSVFQLSHDSKWRGWQHLLASCPMIQW